MEHWLKDVDDWRLPGHDRKFDVYWCADDEFGKLLPTPDADTIEYHYNVRDYYTRGPKTSDTETPVVAKAGLLDKIAYRLDFGLENSNQYIADRLGDAPKRVLEIGCGHGDKIVALSQMGYECMGIEPDPNSFARQDGFALRVEPGTAEHPPANMASEKFDAVIMNHVYEHTVDAIQAAKNAASFLNDDGFLFIEVPNIRCLDARVSILEWPHLDIPRHLNHFSEKSLRRTIEKADLSVDFITFAHFNRQFQKSWLEFGKPIRSHFNTTNQVSGSLKQLGFLYSCGLLAATAFAPKSAKYDSIIVVAKKA